MSRLKKNNRRLSVVVPVFNRAHVVGRTLEQIFSQVRKPNEVIVIDDGSTDNTAAVVKKFPVRYFYQENAGPAAARNAGWRQAKNEIVVFTDSDCLPEKNWLKNIEGYFVDPQVGAVGGAYKTANRQKLLPRLIGYDIGHRYSSLGKYIDAHGSYNLAVRRKILEQIGGFNEAYPVPTAEDWDLCYKIIEKGYKIAFAPKARVGGFHREGLVRYLKDQFRHGYYRMLLYRDHPQMIAGDKYSGSAKWQVAVSFFLIALFALAVFLIPFYSSLAGKLFLIFIVAAVFNLAFSFSLVIFLWQQKISLLEICLSALLRVIRGWAWSLGALKGGLAYGSLSKIGLIFLKSIIKPKSFPGKASS